MPTGKTSKGRRPYFALLRNSLLDVASAVASVDANQFFLIFNLITNVYKLLKQPGNDDSLCTLFLLRKKRNFVLVMHKNVG